MSAVSERSAIEAMNPRWLAFCRATGTNPESPWSASLGVRFVTWVSHQVEDFAALHPQHMALEFVAPNLEAQDAFTAFLNERPIEEEATR